MLPLTRFTFGPSFGMRLCRSFSSARDHSNPFRVAIVGTGPSGFYCAKYLFQNAQKTENNLHIDMMDMLPTPFGLVRFGIAPDHPEVKNVENDFRLTLANENCRFFGNVELGKDISVDDLSQHYHAIILAYGAGGERKLHISGEDLTGVHGARSFVNWYNGHPDYCYGDYDLSNQDNAVVIGNGNVAIDIARILVKPVEDLETTDMPIYATEALKNSRIKNVHVIGRRGPIQAAFTRKEFKELTRVLGVQVHVSAKDIAAMEENPSDVAELKNRVAKRKIQMLEPLVDQPPKEKNVYFHFFESPSRCSGTHKLEAVELQRNRLQGDPGAQRVVSTDESTTLQTGLLFASIGYQSYPTPGLPFDRNNHVIPSEAGRVITENGVYPGYYVSGWLKRGPSGILGTNIGDAKETVTSLTDDLFQTGSPPASVLPDITSLLTDRGVSFVDKQGWERIDAKETENAGEKPRTKIVYRNELLEAARFNR